MQIDNPNWSSEWDKRLAAFLDGEMTEDDRRAFLAEAAEDPDRAEQLRQFRALDEVLAEVGEDALDVDYFVQREAILTALPPRTPPPRRMVRFVLQPALAALAAAAVLLLVVGVYRTWQPVPSTSEPPAAGKQSGAPPVVVAVAEVRVLPVQPVSAAPGVVQGGIIRRDAPQLAAVTSSTGTVVISTPKPHDPPRNEALTMLGMGDWLN